MSGSLIEWTDVTWNPVTGCDQISRGCQNCYALALAKRLKGMGRSTGSPKYQNDGDPRTSGPGFGVTVHPGSLRIPYSLAGRQKIFVNSMSDLFHARVPLGFVQDVFDVMRDTPQHTYQVLTKRSARLPKVADRLEWPRNLWMGVSVEDQGTLFRVAHLREVPVPVRFVSCEPLLGPLPGLSLDGIHQVIAGGESGKDARPMDLAWPRAVRDECDAAETAFFMKQLGRVAGLALGAGPKGGNWDKWPEDLRIRQFPFAQEPPAPAAGPRTGGGRP